MTDEVVQKKRLHCKRCNYETNHELKGEHRGVFGDPESFQEVLTYRLWICMGCERGLLEEEYTIDGSIEEFEYFPEPSKDFLFAKSYSKLRTELRTIYEESITCYNKKALILCAAGLRALLEGI